LGLALASPSFAADLAPILKDPLPAAAPIVAGWTGFYGGIHGGYGWGQKTFVDNFPVFDGEIDADTHIQGGLGGLQLGYNQQFNWLVVGVEGNFSWADVKQNFSCFGFGDQICSSTADWFASVTGRVGVAAGPALFYGKGGLAWVHDHFTDLATCSGSQPTSSGGINAACGDQFISNQTRAGWSAAASSTDSRPTGRHSSSTISWISGAGRRRSRMAPTASSPRKSTSASTSSKSG
jgi:hypothetical protein